MHTITSQQEYLSVLFIYIFRNNINGRFIGIIKWLKILKMKQYAIKNYVDTKTK